MKPSQSKKKGKKKKKSSPPAAAPAPTPVEGAADSEACSRLPETLTLAAAAVATAAVSETESSSSGEASTCASSACFTASSSGTASSSSLSAFSSSASTASSSAAGEERRDLTWLLDAFASATIDQIDSAYREAGGDPFVAAGILGSTQDTQPPQPPQPAPQPPPPPDLSPRSGSGGRKAGRRPKRVAVAATGMVADVIGKEYTRPVTAPVSVPNAWKGRDGERDGGSGGRKYSVEEAEQFLCSMLGDNTELGMGVVRDVLGQYGYDVEKALDALLDISGVSSVENMETNHQNAGRNDTRHLYMFPGNGLSVDNLTAGNRRSLQQLTDEISNTRFQSELGHEFLWGEPQIRFIRRREALVYNTPGDHVTRDIREGVAKLGDLRFRVLDSAGLETAATSGSILARTADMTGNVLARSQFAIFLIDVRDGLQPLDLEVGQWLRKHASGIHTLVAMNKSESLDEHGLLTAAAGEAHKLGFGDPVAISAETCLGMAELYEILRPLFEEYMFQLPNNDLNQDDPISEVETEAHDESKLPLQLAIVGRPNVGKSTLLNTLLQEQRVLVGPEAGLTRDSIRAQFQFDDRTVYLVDTAGWMERSGKEKGPASLSVVQSRKNLMRAHIVALVLDAEKIAKSKSSMNHPEVVIARQAIEEGRGLVVIVNKMDLLRDNQTLFNKVMDAVPSEIQTVIPQVTGIPVVFVSALEGRGRVAVMRQVIDTYEKWCLRLSTSRLNRWLRKVMSRHSWKDSATQPKVKYFTQVKARPPTFVAFMSGKTQLSDTDIRFLTKSLKEDFDIGGIPIRIVQRSIPRKASAKSNTRNTGTRIVRMKTDKRTTVSDPALS